MDRGSIEENYDYEAVADYISDRAFEMAVILYGDNPSEEQLEECIECLRNKWGI